MKFKKAHLNKLGFESSKIHHVLDREPKAARMLRHSIKEQWYKT